VRVVVGGAPVTEQWAHEIGADAYGANAAAAVPLARKLLAG
jgi:methanogenic corrinoid protein MtbC1